MFEERTLVVLTESKGVAGGSQAVAGMIGASCFEQGVCLISLHFGGVFLGLCRIN